MLPPYFYKFLILKDGKAELHELMPISNKKGRVLNWKDF
jgi:hypothetical protein